MGNLPTGVSFKRTHETYLLRGVTYESMQVLEKFFKRRHDEGFEMYVKRMDSGELVDADDSTNTISFFIQVPRCRMVEVLNLLRH